MMAAAALVLLVTLTFMIGASRPHRSLQPWALALVNLGSLMVGVGAPLGVLASIAAIGVLELPLVHRAGLTLAAIAIGASVVARQGLGASWRTGYDETKRSVLVSNSLRLRRFPPTR